MATPRPYDIVVFGATGFTGRQAAHFLSKNAPEGLKWAVAARSQPKLDAIAREVGGVDTLQVDVGDSGAVQEMVGSTRVLITTVGPYSRYGTGVLAACADLGTDYVDITGESAWVRRMIDAHHDRAVETGARIVPFCGFDSIPSDLGAFMMARHLGTLGQKTVEVRALFSAGGGGINGGTLQSALEMGQSGDGRMMADPFLLNPKDQRPGPAPERSRDPKRPSYDPDLKAWRAPFFMSAINTRVVRRSNALFTAEGRGYGDDFAYQEWLKMPGRPAAYVMTGVVGGFAALMASPLGRSLVERFGPDAGQGPSEEKMDEGFFKTALVAKGSDGALIRGRITSQGDPGNRSTIRMLGASALCLALDRTRLPKRAGILTPATAFGEVLLERLRGLGMGWEILAD